MWILFRRADLTTHSVLWKPRGFFMSSESPLCISLNTWNLLKHLESISRPCNACMCYKLEKNARKIIFKNNPHDPDMLNLKSFSQMLQSNVQSYLEAQFLHKNFTLTHIHFLWLHFLFFTTKQSLQLCRIAEDKKSWATESDHCSF